MKTILRRDRTSEEKHIDAIVRNGLMRLGENPSAGSPERASRFAVTEPHRPPNAYPHYLFWDRFGRKGQKCRILQLGNINSRNLQVQFEDGWTAIINRRAIRRREP